MSLPISAVLLHMTSHLASAFAPVTANILSIGNSVVSDSRWSAPVTHNSWAALLAWFLLLIVLQAVSWPLVRACFSRFPDRGWGFARLISMLLAGYGVWLFSSLEMIAFRAIWCGVALLAVAAGSRILAQAITLTPTRGWESWWNNRVVVGCECLFWGVFGLFLLFRLLNPDSYHPYWGGEKPMEFAHINALLRTASFPPADPWYAGGLLNYYYFGEYLVAFLIKLTGIPSEIAFNLAQPTIVAFLATGSFSVGAAFGGSVIRRVSGVIASGLLAVVLVGFAGNLVFISRVIDQLLHGAGSVYEFGYWFWDPSRAIPDPASQAGITEFPYFSATFGDLHAHVLALPITVLIIGLVYSLCLDWRMVTVAVTTRPGLSRFRGHLLARLCLLALLTGILWPTNAWDVPMFVALIGVCLLMATRGIAHIWRRLGVCAMAFLIIAGMAYASVLPFMRASETLFTSVGIQDANTPLVSIESHLGVFLAIIFAGLMYLSAATGSLPRALANPGIVLTGLAAVLMFRWWATSGNDVTVRIADGLTVVVVVGVLGAAFLAGSYSWLDFRLPSWLPTAIVASGLCASGVLVLLDRPVPAVYLGIGSVAVAHWLVTPQPTPRFLAAMIAAAMLLGATLELVYLRDTLDGSPHYRMNTLFKFYNQIWTLVALASAGLIAHMGAEVIRANRVDQLPQNDEDTNDEGEPVRWSRPSFASESWARAGVALAAIMLVAALAYPLGATRFRLDQRFEQASPGGFTLNAHDWMNYGQIQYADGTWVGYRDDRAAIDWLNTHVDGTPVIAEASFGVYRCNGSRFSVATGLPSVIGWASHESQQRSDGDLQEREIRLRELYTSGSTETIRQVIDQYGVEYIIVGDTERYYPQISGNACAPGGSATGILAIESLVGSNLEIAFRSGTTTIYRVLAPT